MAAVEKGPEVAVVSTTINNDAAAYVDWPAVVAGAVIAAAISFMLFTFGTAVGLSVTSPYPAQSVSGPTFAILAAVWILWVTVSSFLIGGYFTGLLMRRRVLAEHEREMRDGMHGALAWALGVLLGALIAGWTVGGAARTGVETAAQAVAASADKAPSAYFADVMLRSDNPSAVAPAETEQRRAEVNRIFLRNPSGDIPAADRAYLGQLVMRQTGLPEAEASARAEKVVTEYRDAVASAQQAAEKARKFALLLAFAVAATLVISAAAAWWAAVQGGEHRDQSFDFRPHIGWSRGRFRDRPSS
ncbi:hypothetical protein [Taklimakanibacter deserti]|uniref:hypothetical protein n=1 Tax=Taklimakanibacter deserti TaxID=2267839 RepID=UPI0013C3F901